jgi:uncharacterized Zn finger protein
MYIKRNGNIMTMTESLVCPNFSDANLKHFKNDFEKVNDNTYKCNECGSIMKIMEPISVIHDENGRLKMQVQVESIREVF